MNRYSLVIAVTSLFVGAYLGAKYDTRIMRLVSPSTKSDYYTNRVDWLERFPVERPIAFAGDSHIERAPIAHFMNAANYGVGEDTTEGLKSRMGNIRADRLILLIGVNDLHAGRSPQDIAATVSDIILKFDGDITLLSIPPVVGWRWTSNADTAATNSLLQTVCAGRCTFVDLWPALAINGELNTAYTEDGLHLNADGYQALFNQLK